MENESKIKAKEQQQEKSKNKRRETPLKMVCCVTQEFPVPSLYRSVKGELASWISVTS
jgi:hypothetical protein